MSEVLTDETVIEQPTIEMLRNAEGAVHLVGEDDDPASEAASPAVPKLVDSGEGPDIPEVDPEIAKLGQAALQIAMQIRQLLETGEQIVMLLVKSDLADKFEAAFRGVPENILPGDFVSKVPVMPDPECDGVRIIVRTDLIREFLLRYYGPPSGGGNGLIQAMEDAISRIPNCPIRIDLKTLEILYLLELKERVKPGIVVPTGANLRQGVPQDLLRR